MESTQACQSSDPKMYLSRKVQVLVLYALKHQHLVESVMIPRLFRLELICECNYQLHYNYNLSNKLTKSDLTLQARSLKKKYDNARRNYLQWHTKIILIIESYHGKTTRSVLQIPKSKAGIKLKKRQFKKFLELSISCQNHEQPHVAVQVTLQLIEFVPKHHYKILTDGASAKPSANLYIE